ncbi:L,D-transpeptidase family protein [Sporomusa termitida]|uniref:Spore cortex-lytic enzyme n=1 Tax=Sporomusa termitida TaxID=2377 RepID=A0A517DT40_9FIRM|nr:L,D-transpeptidase family protein [Sporomusa termitida]QDR80456.1 spore cortex-lytic enzyme [Sporomusa termitida]
MWNIFLFLRKKHFYLGVSSLIFVALLVSFWVVDYMDEVDLAALPNQPTIPPNGNVSLKINVASRMLELYNDGSVYKVYRIAVGKKETPTPIGEWTIVWKDYNWGTGFGSRWLGLNVPWGTYGIHGTNKPWSIGSFASHGCIRMRNKDVEELFEWVPINTAVKIEGSKIKFARTLKQNMAGQDVVLLQLRLKELGYLTDRADGLFGANTDKAVKQFQADKGLEATGLVTKKIFEALEIKSEI